MSFPFKIIHGNQSESTLPPAKFAQYDQRRAIGDRIMTKFFANRNKAIDRERAKLNKL